MVSLLGSSTISQSPFLQSLPRSFQTTSQRKHGRKKMAIMVSMQPENPNDTNFMKRRALLLVGLSVFPILQSKARTIEDLMKGKDFLGAQAEKTENRLNFCHVKLLKWLALLPQQVRQNRAPANPFLGFLNGVGIIGVGVLGALYALAQKEKASLNSTIESMTIKLNEKEATVAERMEEIRKVKEERDNLSNQLASANRALTGLQQEFQSEKTLAQSLREEIDHLEGVIAKEGEDKKALIRQKQGAVDILQRRIDQLSLDINKKEISIKNLNLSLAGKESEFRSLTSIFHQTKRDLAQANSAVEDLKEEICKIRKELELKKSSEKDLKARLMSLVTEKNDIEKSFHVLREEYDNLKSASARRAASDAKLLSDKDHELNQLKGKLESYSNEASNNESLIAGLTGERDNLRTMMEKEASIVNNLRGELQFTRETLEESRLEAADLLKQLNHSKMSCEALTSEVSRIQAESEEVQKSLNQNLDEVKLRLKQRSDELVSIKEALMKTKQELLLMTDKLKDVMEACEDLKKELLEVNKKSERTANDLKEEKKLVASLNKKVAELRKHTSEDKDARSKLERDLQDAAKSLEEMNRKALTLSRELEMANSKCANLESEKDMLATSLAEEKNFAKEVRENLEVAHENLTGVHEEMENLEKRSEELKVELATAKAEIEKLKKEPRTVRGRKRVPRPEASQ